MSIEQIADSAARHGPSELKHIDYLDGWRGLAIVLVLQHHFFLIPGFGTGRLGVDIFFCLSGLLMSKILFVRRVPLGTFYKRRISRIIPAFFIYVFMIVGLAALAGQPPVWPEIVSTLLFLRAYFPADLHIYLSVYPIGQLWSLNVEEHCYIFLSALTLIKVLRGREGWALILVGSLSVVIYAVYFLVPEIAPPGIVVTTEATAGNLLVSAGYALLKDRMVPRVKPWMPVVAFFLAASLYGIHWLAAMTVAPFLLAFVVNHLTEAPPVVRRILSSAPLRFMGICSYSIYLWQQPFYQYRETLPDMPIEQVLLLLFMALGVGIFMFYRVENPIRAYLNRVW